jgi:LuxR family transcriptional regulator, maltose regulon positive regulatory protein
VLSLLAGDQDDQTAGELAARAAAVAEAQGLSAEPLCGIAYLALGRSLTRQGRLTEAEKQLEGALELFGIDSMNVQRAHALLLLASVRHGQGDLPGATALLEQGHELIEQMADPGSLPSLLEQSSHTLGSAPRRRIEVAAALTERELAVLQLLPSRLSTREIGRELSVSVHTVRSQVQAIFRKLQVTSRADAVTQARQLGLLPDA